jgi:peptidoglycan hydrolase-like protein with peptidoglycan-binding domain
MLQDEAVEGGWRFGPVTEASLTKFQSASGVTASGTYGDATAGALRRALAADLPPLPTQELEAGVESDDVAQLQTALETLGYIDRVTAYFGPLTFDAVAQFQREHGLEATGIYEAITRMALASALRHRVVEAPAAPILAAGNVRISE